MRLIYHLFTIFAITTSIFTNMKKIFSFSVVAIAMLLALGSCSEKKRDTIIITKKQPIIVKASKPQKMGDYTQSRSVEWLGNKYTVESRFMADTSLPLTSDGVNKYYDNLIRVRIIRADGSEFFNRTFKKTDFQSYVDDYYYKKGALLGIVYVKTVSNALVFAASVGNPDKSSDEYVPLVLKINNFGAVTISKDSQLDTSTDPSEEEEESV